MSLIDKLVGLLRGASGSEDDPIAAQLPDEHMAAAALLVHVARVDGIIQERERDALLSMLEGSHGLDRAGAQALVKRAERLDMEIDDVGTLVERLGHEGHGPDRARLLGMAYRIAAADSGLAEFEEDLLWRLGQLLRFDDATIADIRARNVGEGLVAEGLGA